MAHELRVIDVSDEPDVLRLAESVAASRVPVRLETRGKQLAVIQPVPVPPRSRRDHAVSRTDSLFDLVGIGESAGGGCA